MKIAYVSDLHLEHDRKDTPFILEKKDDVDVLVLAGDIFPVKGFSIPTVENVYKPFFEAVNRDFKNIIYIFGNHEHYQGDIRQNHTIAKEVLKQYENIKVLENEYLDIGDVRFVCATLWTDINRGCPFAHHSVQNMLNDYRWINKGEKRLSPYDTKDIHAETMRVIKGLLNHPKVVLVTHHAPSHLSIDFSRYGQTDANFAYYSDLSEFILDNEQIVAWIHGHTHRSSDYMIGNTRVVSNPRGYVYGERDSQEADPFFYNILEV